jgi:hypothetical protein
MAPAALAAAAVLAPAPAAAEPAAPRGGVHGELSAISLFALGALPSPALGVSPYLGFRWPDVSLSLEARFLTGIDRDPIVAGTRTQTSMVMAIPTLCGHHRWLFLCGVLGVGEIRASGDGSVSVTTEQPWLVAFGFRGGLDLHLSPSFAVRGYLEGLGVGAQPAVQVDGAPPWQAPFLALSVGLGIMIPLGGAPPRSLESRP